MSDWGSGYTANVTLTNNGTASVTGWTVSFDLGVPITSFWSAKGSQSGTKATFTNESWNGVIAPGKSVTFGIQTSSSADKTAKNFVINGVASSTGSTGGSTGGRLVRPAALPAEAREARPAAVRIPEAQPAEIPAAHGRYDGGSTGGTTGGTTGSGSTATGSVAFAVTSDWGSGYSANVTVTNNGTTSLSSWTVSFDLDVPDHQLLERQGRHEGGQPLHLHQ